MNSSHLLSVPIDTDAEAKTPHDITFPANSVPKGIYKLKYTAVVTKDASKAGKVLNGAAYQVGNNSKVELNSLTNPVSAKIYGEDDWEDGKFTHVGEKIPYRITLGNANAPEDGNVDIVIKDTMTRGLKYNKDLKLFKENGEEISGVTIEQKETSNSDKSVTHTWTLKGVPARTIGYVSYSATVEESAVEKKKVSNSATIKYGDEEEMTLEKLTNPLVKKDVFAGDDTEFKTSIDGKPVKVGQQLLYKVQYSNTTGKDQEVAITDKIPEHTKYVEDSADNGGTYDDTTKTVTWKKTVKDGDELAVTFKVEVEKDTSGEAIINKANIKDGVNKSGVNTNETNNQTHPKKEVFDKDDDTTNIDGKQVKPGDELKYKVTYKNGTGKDREVTITDKIPKYTEYVKGSADNGGIYDEATKTITWKKTVKDGESFVVTFNVKVNEDVAGEPVENEAVVKDGQNEDGLVTNETKNPTTPKKDVFAKGDDKTSIDGKQVKPGDELKYKIKYRNGTGKEQKVTITDKIPKYTKYVKGSADNDGRYNAVTKTITWKKTVKDGDSFVVTFKVQVKDVKNKSIDNVAKVKDGAGAYELDTNGTGNPVGKISPKSPDKPKSPHKVDTGDGMQLCKYLIILTLSLLLLLLLKRRRAR